ncbi:hypothetical protein HYU06_05595 [Candidatus Woesearchaeota archaeon]|nr:hypothetical protein [Candidatus Woesearchaeota archaeon]
MAKKGKLNKKRDNKTRQNPFARCKHMLLVKRHGHLEHFDVKKIYASVYAATLNAHYSEKDAEMIAAMVSKNVHKKACKLKKIDSDKIRIEIIHELNQVDKDIAFLYETHLDIN